MNNHILKWKTIDDVPQLIVEWANCVADETLHDIDDIINSIISYEDWMNTFYPIEEI